MHLIVAFPPYLPPDDRRQSFRNISLHLRKKNSSDYNWHSRYFERASWSGSIAKDGSFIASGGNRAELQLLQPDATYITRVELKEGNNYFQTCSVTFGKDPFVFTTFYHTNNIAIQPGYRHCL